MDPQPSTMMDPQLTSQLVTEQLQAMNNVLERVELNLSNTQILDVHTLMPVEVLEPINPDTSDTQLPIPTVDVATPPLSMSTVETNTVYETLLETNSSAYSSVPSCETLIFLSTGTVPQQSSYEPGEI